MKLAYLEEADQSSVVHTIRDLLKDRGALITELTHNRVRFEGLRMGDYAFAKGGQVGVYQRVGEKEVQVRLKVEATVPARIFWRTVTAELLIGLLVFVLNPTPEVYTLAAALLWAGLILTFLLYLGTWRTSFQLERELLRDIVESLRHRADAPSGIELEEDRLMREFEDRLDGEVARARLKETRRSRGKTKGGGSTFLSALKSAKKEPKPPQEPKPGLFQRLKERRLAKAEGEPAGAEEDDGAKRERIEALRAEIERRKRERQV